MHHGGERQVGGDQGERGGELLRVGRVAGGQGHHRAVRPQFGGEFGGAGSVRAPAAEQQQPPYAQVAYQVAGESGAERAAGAGNQDGAVAEVDRGARGVVVAAQPGHGQRAPGQAYLRFVEGGHPRQVRRVDLGVVVQEDEPARVFGAGAADEPGGDGQGRCVVGDGEDHGGPVVGGERGVDLVEDVLGDGVCGGGLVRAPGGQRHGGDRAGRAGGGGRRHPAPGQHLAAPCHAHRPPDQGGDLGDQRAAVVHRRHRQRLRPRPGVRHPQPADACGVHLDAGPGERQRGRTGVVGHAGQRRVQRAVEKGGMQQVRLHRLTRVEDDLGEQTVPGTPEAAESLERRAVVVAVPGNRFVDAGQVQLLRVGRQPGAADAGRSGVRVPTACRVQSVESAARAYTVTVR